MTLSGHHIQKTPQNTQSFLVHMEHSLGLTTYWASLVTQLVKNLPAMQETCVLFLGWEDPLEKGIATHSSILATY